MPGDWSLAVTCPIYKDNYCGISLLNWLYNIFSKILVRTLEPYVEKQLGEYQCGFRHNRSIIDHISSLLLILEKCYDVNIHLFVDYKEAGKS